MSSVDAVLLDVEDERLGAVDDRGDVVGQRVAEVGDFGGDADEAAQQRELFDDLGVARGVGDRRRAGLQRDQRGRPADRFEQPGAVQLVGDGDRRRPARRGCTAPRSLRRCGRAPACRSRPRSGALRRRRRSALADSSIAPSRDSSAAKSCGGTRVAGTALAASIVKGLDHGDCDPLRSALGTGSAETRGFRCGEHPVNASVVHSHEPHRTERV